MFYAAISVIIAAAGWGIWKQTQKAIEKNETVRSYDPKRLKWYLLISTLINLMLLALSFYVFKDKAIYAFKLALVMEWIVGIAAVDYLCYVIPNKFIVIGSILALLLAAIEIVFASYPVLLTLKDYFFGFLLGAGVFLISALISKGSIGMGDVKFFAVLGLLLGWTGVFALLFFTILISAVTGGVLLLLKKGNKKTLLPLAPFAYLGMVIIILLGV